MQESRISKCRNWKSNVQNKGQQQNMSSPQVVQTKNKVQTGETWQQMKLKHDGKTRPGNRWGTPPHGMKIEKSTKSAGVKEYSHAGTLSSEQHLGKICDLTLCLHVLFPLLFLVTRIPGQAVNVLFHGSLECVDKALRHFNLIIKEQALPLTR